jgi:hypothetical protein
MYKAVATLASILGLTSVSLASNNQGFQYQIPVSADFPMEQAAGNMNFGLELPVPLPLNLRAILKTSLRVDNGFKGGAEFLGGYGFGLERKFDGFSLGASVLNYSSSRKIHPTNSEEYSLETGARAFELYGLKTLAETNSANLDFILSVITRTGEQTRTSLSNTTTTKISGTSLKLGFIVTKKIGASDEETN